VQNQDEALNTYDKINIVLSPMQLTISANTNFSKMKDCPYCETETQHTYEIAKKVAEILRGYNANVCLIPKILDIEDIIKDSSDVLNVSDFSVIAESIISNCNHALNRVIEISNNFITANGGRGFHLNIYNDMGFRNRGSNGYYSDEAGKTFILHINNALKKILPWGYNEIFLQHSILLDDVIATSADIEISFFDGIEASKWLHVNMDALAMNIVYGMTITTGLHRVRDAKHPAESDWEYLKRNGIEINEKKFGEMVNRGDMFALMASMYRALVGDTIFEVK
jgi:hypothetical protein